MDTYTLAVNNLKQAITTAINKAIEKGELPQAEIPQFIIETPADRSHGDFVKNRRKTVAESSAARIAHMHRAGRICGNKFNHYLFALPKIGATVFFGACKNFTHCV